MRPITAPGSFRDLARDEGSLQGTLGSDPNEPTWTDRSVSTYHGNVRNGRTGAKQLLLPLITVGSQPIELIRRPVPGENAFITGQRMYSEAGVRILLSNTAAAITALPDSSNAVAPVNLNTLGTMQAGGYGGAIPPAASTGVTATGYRMGMDTPLIGGFLKIEYRNAADAWNDVTAEMLNLGFTRRNIEVGGCAADEPSPNAIIRFQRGRTAPSTGAAAPAACGGAVAGDFWPLALYDMREGKPRDNEAVGSTNIYLGGVMHYVELDVNNFRRWLAGHIGASGNQVVNEDGFALYFSDRRTNQDAAATKAASTAGRTSSTRPAPPARRTASWRPARTSTATAPSRSTAARRVADGRWSAWSDCLEQRRQAAHPRSPTRRPNTIVPRPVPQANRPVLFRRALKVANGGVGNLPPDGLNITSREPGLRGGTTTTRAERFGAPPCAGGDHVRRGDAAVGQLEHPRAGAQRRPVDGHGDTRRSAPRPTSGSPPPPRITGSPRCRASSQLRPDRHAGQLTAPTAAYHNFMHLMEGWTNKTLNYKGSIASFFYSRQALGLFRCCNNVYKLPTTRNLSFDTNFLDPQLLPPKTPMFRDVNTTGFNQVTRR